MIFEIYCSPIRASRTFDARGVCVIVAPSDTHELSCSVFFSTWQNQVTRGNFFFFVTGYYACHRLLFWKLSRVTQNCHGLLFQKLSRVAQAVTGYFFKICHGLDNVCHGLLFTKFSTIEMQGPRGSFCLHEEFMFLFKVLFRAVRGCPRVARVYIPLGQSAVK